MGTTRLNFVEVLIAQCTFSHACGCCPTCLVRPGGADGTQVTTQKNVTKNLSLACGFVQVGPTIWWGGKSAFKSVAIFFLDLIRVVASLLEQVFL